MSDSQSVTACVLIIGNEVLSGRTRDANLPFIAQGLNDMGVRLREARIIPDDAAVIVDAVNACRTAFDYVITTGGIGPTHDDITSACVARAFGVALVRDPDAEARLRRQYRADDLNEARLKMADVPEGATLVDNPVSGAPGYRMGNVFVLAGVPAIMRAMFDGLRGQLRGGAPVRSRTVSAFTTEGAVAKPLADVQDRFPATEIGSYPFVRDGRFGVSLVIRSTDGESLHAAADAVSALVRAAGAEPIVEDESP